MIKKNNIKLYKKWSKNPTVWFISIIIFGYIIISNNRGFEGLIVFILALIVAKQIEIINLYSEK